MKLVLFAEGPAASTGQGLAAGGRVAERPERAERAGEGRDAKAEDRTDALFAVGGERGE